MKQILRYIFYATFFVCLPAIVTANAQTPTDLATDEVPAKCSLKTLSGGYGFEGNGFLRLGGETIPTAAIGDFTFDGQGAVAGVATQSLNGAVTRIPQKGTYTVNPDCTGSVVTNGADGIIRTFDFIILRGGNEILTLATRSELVSAFSLKKK